MSDFKAKMHHIRFSSLLGSLQRSQIPYLYLRGPAYKRREGDGNKGGKGKEKVEKHLTHPGRKFLATPLYIQHLVLVKRFLERSIVQLGLH